MYCNFIQTKDHAVLLCCDKELAGKTITEDGLEVELKKEVYAKQQVNEKEFAKLLQKASSINLFGEKCVKTAIEEGFASEKSVKTIDGVKHLQIYKLW